jgi:hypothetical protein
MGPPEPEPVPARLEQDPSPSEFRPATAESEWEKECETQDRTAFLSQLDAELGLGPDRVEALRQVLLDRRERIREYHARI